MQHQDVVADAEQTESLPAALGVLRDSHLDRAAESLDEEFVGLGRDWAGRLETVTLGDLQRVDGLQWHEGVDLDRLRSGQREVAEVLVGDRDDRVFDSS